MNFSKILLTVLICLIASVMACSAVSAVDPAKSIMTVDYDDCSVDITLVDEDHNPLDDVPVHLQVRNKDTNEEFNLWGHTGKDGKISFDSSKFGAGNYEAAVLGLVRWDVPLIQKFGFAIAEDDDDESSEWHYRG